MILIGMVSMIILNFIFIGDYGAEAVVFVNLIIYSIINFSFYLKAKQLINSNNVQ